MDEIRKIEKINNESNNESNIESDLIEKIKTLGEEEFLEQLRDHAKQINVIVSQYKCAIMEIETKFKVLNEQFSLEYDRNPIESIKTRIKSFESIAEKMQRKKLPLNLESLEENLNDIAGVRVICAFPEDIYVMAECLLKQDDITLIELKDYILNPKENGYRSLHMIVSVPIFLKDEKKDMKVEVQFRTIAMDFWASLEHKIRYKKDIPEGEQTELVNDLLDCANQIAKLDMRMQNIRSRIERLGHPDE